MEHTLKKRKLWSGCIATSSKGVVSLAIQVIVASHGVLISAGTIEVTHFLGLKKFEDFEAASARANSVLLRHFGPVTKHNVIKHANETDVISRVGDRCRYVR